MRNAHKNTKDKQNRYKTYLFKKNNLKSDFD